MKNRKLIRRTTSSVAIVLSLLAPSLFVSSLIAEPASASGVAAIPDTGFEGGSLNGWDSSSASRTFTEITANGQGAGIISGTVQFTHGARSARANCAPAVTAATWAFGPFGSHAGAIQPTGSGSFDAALVALGMSSSDNSAIKSMITAQAVSSRCGGSTNPTNAAWLRKTVTLTAGTTYQMAWNYIGTDYAPYNDGSVTSLIFKGVGTPTVTVNNQVQSYALLGFTNPGTGDYSTGSYGSTGWQYSTYEVSISGTYDLGFAVFNIGDTSLSPVLLVDDGLGVVTRNGETFGAVVPNNPQAPSLVNRTVTYAANNADSGSAPVNSTGSGSITVAPNSGNLAKSGFTFAGWNTLSDGTGVTYQPGDSFTPSANLTLYAKWTAVVSSPPATEPASSPPATVPVLNTQPATAPTLAITGPGSQWLLFAFALTLVTGGATLLAVSNLSTSRKKTRLNWERL